MLLDEAMNQFLDSRCRRGCCDETRRKYQLQVFSLVSYLRREGIERVEQIVSRHVSDYLLYLRERDKYRVLGSKVSPVTVRKTAIGLRTFFKWLGHDVRFDIPRVGKRLPKSLDPKDIDRLLKSEMTSRDRAIIYLMLDSGLRLNEVRLLCLRDVDLDTGMVHVLHGKGDKERWAVFSSATSKALRLWIADRGEQKTDILFVGEKGNQFSANGLYCVVKRVACRAGLDLSPHKLRHTFATQFLDAGGAITDLQLLMGHESIGTTMVYLNVSIGRVRERFGKFSVLNRLSDLDRRGI